MPAPTPEVASRNPGQRFSVILVNYNGAGVLPAAARSAVREGVPAAQIHIVDNGSTDDSLAELEQAIPGALVLRNRYNTGFAHAVNQALCLVKTDFALLLNNDAVLDPGALQTFAAAFDQTPELAFAGGQLRYPDGRLQSAFAPLPTLAQEVIPMALLKLWRPEHYRRSTPDTAQRLVESVFGACFAVRMAAVADVGALDDEFFFYFEEVDWCRRAQLRGWHVAYLPTARATHHLGRTANLTRGPARVELQRSKLLYFRKSGSALRSRVLSAFLVIRTLVNAVSATVVVFATLGSKASVRAKSRTYWHMLAWHLSGRPTSWGLPGKAPQAD